MHIETCVIKSAHVCCSICNQSEQCVADHAAVAQALQQLIQHPKFGMEQDAVCGWFYEWYRSSDPVLKRFVARFAPDLAKRFLLHCLSSQQTEPVPGLEVTSAKPDLALLFCISCHALNSGATPWRSWYFMHLCTSRTSGVQQAPSYNAIKATL